MNNNSEFISCVKEVFRFLVDDYGYEYSNPFDNQVKYSYKNHSINFYYESYSYNIYAILYLEQETQSTIKQIYLNDFINIFLKQKTQVNFTVRENIGIRQSLKKIAKTLLANQNEVLMKSTKDYLKVINYINSYYDEKILREKIQKTESKVQEAWKSKDYKKVVTLYSSITKHLSKTQQKRNKYALKMLNRKRQVGK